MDKRSVRALQLAREVVTKFGVSLTPERINYLLRKRGLAAPPGRPFKEKRAEEQEAAPDKQAATSTANAGLFFPGSSQDSDGSQSGH